ncbi:MAG: hypothetical protein KIT45_07605 [Fimbriimonadia bacterium]|nr:hypothetical protein [Fimbriimonadia bacterium]
MKNSFMSHKVYGLCLFAGVSLGFFASPVIAQPLSGTSSSATPAVSGTNTGTGRAGQFIVNNASSSAAALFGQTNGTGAAVFGIATGTSGFPTGIWGQSAAPTGTGLYGVATSTTGVNYGIYGLTNSPSGYAAYLIGRSFFSTNVGIGTASPAHLLDIFANSGTAARILNTGAGGTGLFGHSSATTGFGVGITGRADSPTGTGVYAVASRNTGVNYGVYALTNSASGYAGYFLGRSFFSNNTGFGTNSPIYPIHAVTNSTAEHAYVIYGEISSMSPGAFSTGVFGYNKSTSSTGIGVWGRHNGSGYGVYGTVSGTTGTAVAGIASSDTGANRGGYFETSSSAGVGVFGKASSTSSTMATGVFGESDSGAGVGVYGKVNSTVGANFGVAGETLSTLGTGVAGFAYAASGSAVGLLGQSASSSGEGVKGNATATSGVTTGVTGAVHSPNGRGMIGIAYSTTGLAYGVAGQSASVDGIGVFGSANANSGLTYGVVGTAVSTDGYAGYFNGRAAVTGNLSKGGGSFKIDHPLDPENKYLYHSFVESPDMMNVYNGNTITGKDGFAVVELPEWFETLNRDFRYQLTVIGEFAQAIIAQKIQGNRFVIRTDKPNIEVSWQVTGIRQDPYANQYRIPVEENKSERERGKYLHPEVYGQPKEKSVHYFPPLQLQEPPQRKLESPK